MPFLDHFCFCCSVRLGVIFAGVYASLCSMTCLYFLGSAKAGDVKEQIERYEVLKQVEDNILVYRVVSILHDHLALVLEIFIVIISLHLVSCFLLITGAIRLSKYLLVPFMILNLVKVLLFLCTHVIAMMCLKKHLPLGELIGATCAGGFYLLFLLYMWVTSVALYQQILLINSEKYRLLYGLENSKVKQVNPTGILLSNKAMEAQWKGNSFRPRNDDSNMLYRDFMAIYSRKRD